MPAYDPKWRDKCRDKLTTGPKAISHIRPGDRIYLGAGSAVPQGMIPFLVAPEAPVGDNAILHLLTLGGAPYTDPKFEGTFRHNALFIGPNVRQAVTDGRADYTPAFLSEIPGMIRNKQIPVDVAILSVTPPDMDGYCSLGTHVDLAFAVLECARLVIAQVNTLMPWTHGQTKVHINQLHHMVEIDTPMPVMPSGKVRPEVEEIAANVARLVMDGCTLQMGIGGIPDAVLRALMDHNDLGIHTEMFSDGVVDLVKMGVINCKKKSLHPGKIVSSFMLGSQKLYDFANDNPMVELYPIDYVNDPFVIAKNDNMVAINAALEIDLTGQVCSDSIGDRFYSGIGGQVDFIRGAARAKHGRPIIALTSTAGNGDVSRIVPHLTDGAGVVTTRGDVHYVVTEWGIAYLHGKTVRQRAMELIQVAHPKFRPWLLAEAKRRKFVYRDQAEPVIKASVFPSQYQWELCTPDGQAYRIRPVKPTDEPMLHEMFYQFTQESVYQRFFTVKKYFPHKSLQSFCNIDYDQDMTLLATVREDVVTRVVGMAMYIRDAATGYADAAFMVSDAYQNRGIGTELARRLTDIALASGVRGYTADVLAANTRMIHVFDKLGFPVESQTEGDAMEVRIDFSRRVEDGRATVLAGT